MSNVNHPTHYNKHPSGIECIDVIEHFSCNVANAIKYLWRADYKDATIEDLEKAVWYVKREIRKRLLTELACSSTAVMSPEMIETLEVDDATRVRMGFVKETIGGWRRP